MLTVLSAVVALALPQHGVLAPGRSLGGVRLGDTRAAVVARWGRDYGACRDCATPSLYWTFKPFEPQGAGVSLRKGRVVAVFTLWSPAGWRTTRGLATGDAEARVTTLYGALPRTSCNGYDALTLRRAGGPVTVFYVANETVWGFGLMRVREPVCR